MVLCSHAPKAPAADPSDGDIVDAVACFRYYAGLADKVHGQTHSSFGGSKLAYTLMQPVGVCGQM